MKNQIVTRHETGARYSITKNIIIPIGISLFFLLGNSACNEKGDKGTIEKQDHIESQKGIGTAETEKMRDIGTQKFNEDKFPEALQTFFALESAYVQKQDYNELWNVYRFIGTILIKQKNGTEALKYFEKSLEIANKCDNKRGIILLHAYLGETYRELGNDSATISNFLQGRKFANSIKNPNNKEIEAKVTLGTDIARRYLKKENNPELAKQYRKECIRLNKETDNIGNTITIKYDIGDFQSHMGEEEKAIEYYNEGLQLSKENKKNRLEETGYNKISNRYKENNSPEEALKYKELEDSVKDIRINEESINQVNEINIKYETEKKEQQITLQNAEISKQSEKEKRLIWTIIAALTAALGLGSAGAMFYRQKRQLRKKNIEIARQKQKVEIQNRELDEKNKIISKKNNDMKESIDAGKQVQEKIVLSRPEYIKKLFPESFVLFKPRDGVSGDFYRFKETKSGKKLFAAVDCTGHGIPGAFVSFSGSKILDAAVEKGLEKPSDILSYLDDEIISLQKEEGQKDVFVKYGMDIALCSRDETTKTLEYSGAVNPIYIINGDDKQTNVKDIKPNKSKIGQRFQGQKNEYKNDSIHITDPNTIVYLSSDGYQDQFGGPNKKKLKRVEFKKYIEQASKVYFSSKEGRNMQDVQKFLEDKFEKRVGDEEQIDDILVMGIKV